MTDEPEFLDRSEIDRIHERSLQHFGGSTGIRDDGLIHSALASARNSYFYGHGDVFDIAAAYAFHIAEAQAFLDGNKRTAAGAAIVFLKGNGVSRLPADEQLYDAMIALANKQMNKQGLASLFRDLNK